MNKREELLSIALQLFASEGYSSIGIQRIVTEAGVTKPTLYHYFGSKEGVLQALFEEKVRPFISSLEKSSQYHGDLGATLDDLLRAYYKFSSEEPDMFRLMISLSVGPSENEAVKAVIKFITEQYTIFATIFEKAVFDHGNLKGKEALLSMLFYGTLATSCVFFLHAGKEMDEETIGSIRKQFMHGIFS